MYIKGCSMFILTRVMWHSFGQNFDTLFGEHRSMDNFRANIFETSQVKKIYTSYLERCPSSLGAHLIIIIILIEL